MTPKVFIRAAALKSTRTSNWVWNIGWASGHKSNHGKDHSLHHMQGYSPGVYCLAQEQNIQNKTPRKHTTIA